MNRTMMLIILCVALFAVGAHANQLEIAASEITTIEPSDKSEGPRILVKWSLPEGFDKKIIDGAVVTMNLALEGKEPLYLDVMPMTKAWDGATTNWTSGWIREGGDYEKNLASPAMATERMGGKISADVYQLVKNQISGTRSNFGFILVSDGGSTNMVKPIAKNDAVKLANARLIISYRNRR